MVEGLVIQWIYKVILAFFVLIFLRNLFHAKATLSSQIMNAFILIPFVLRLLSIR
jgi:hypothetical protein